MPRKATGHAGVGGVSLALGAALVLTGSLRPPFLDGSFLHTPGWAIAIVGGLVLTLAGGMVLLFTFRRVEEPEPEVPAHVAFASRMVIPDDVAGLPAVAPRAPAASAGARLPTPAQPAQQRVAPPRGDIAEIDGQIRELTRKINKAGVMLATGQLSQQGYLAYVEDLKRQRGKLEAQRVRAELRT